MPVCALNVRKKEINANPVSVRRGMTACVVLLTLIIDQASKFFISRSLSLHESVPVIPGVFHLTLVHNRGAAFGMLKNQWFIFIGVSLAAIGYILVVLRRQSSLLQQAALSLVLAGAAGNLIDRVALGYVVDFLDFRVWPVFNAADSAICAGAGLLVWAMISKPKTHA